MYGKKYSVQFVHDNYSKVSLTFSNCFDFLYFQILIYTVLAFSIIFGNFELSGYQLSNTTYYR